MITKKGQALMKKVDKSKFPNHWRKFINEQAVENNIILKKGKEHYCTNCKKYFYADTKIPKTYFAKYTDTYECPHCHNKFNIRNFNIKHIHFAKDIGFYTLVDNQIVFRGFELYSYYNYKTREFISSTSEYYRTVPGFKPFLNNCIYFRCFGSYTIYHLNKKRKRQWRFYTGCKTFCQPNSYNSADEFIKESCFKYIPVNDVKKRFPEQDTFELLNFMMPKSFEFLWKLELYDLLYDASKIKNTGSFYKIFGVPKTFYPFMKEHNIDYRDLQILKVLQKADIKYLQEYRNYSLEYLKYMKSLGYLYDIDIVKKYGVLPMDRIKFILKYASIPKLQNYNYDLQTYYDYLYMCSKLGLSLTLPKNLFPKNLNYSHKKISDKYKIANTSITKLSVYQRFFNLSTNIYEDFKYIIFPAPSVEDFESEAKQQRNCVLSYVNKYKDNQTEIYFMREKSNISQSLVTVEYKDGRILQARRKAQKNHIWNQPDPTDEQQEFLDKWKNFMIKNNKKIHIKNKNSIVA